MRGMLLEVKLKDQLISHFLRMKALNIHLLLCQDLELINKQLVFSKRACAQALHLPRVYRCRRPCAGHTGYSAVPGNQQSHLL